MADTSVAPEIAVVVAAYRRRRFLAGALDSVLAQTIPRKSMEILALADFDDSEIDAHCAREGIACRRDPEPVIGRWLLDAVDATRSPIVAILEDDDLFAPEHLARALERFRAHPETTLYRNRVSVVDEQGAPVPISRWESIERDRGLDAGPIEVLADSKNEGIERLRRSGAEWLNVGTMVFRRTILTPEIRPLIARSICPDLFVFVAAAVSPGSMFFDDARTTVYRHYGTSASRRTGWKQRHWEDHQGFARFVRSRGPSALASWLDARARMLGRVADAADLLDPIRAGAAPASVRGSLRAYLGRRLQERPLDPPVAVRWGAGAVAGAYCVAPGVSRRVLLGLDQHLDLP